MNIKRLFVGFLLFAVPVMAASITDPLFVPETVKAGRPFQVVAETEVCETFPTAFRDDPIRQGDEIVIRGGYFLTEVGPCLAGPITESWDIGPLPEGNYELVVIGVELPPLTGEVELFRGAFGVDPNPNAIPSLSPWSLILVTAAIGAIALSRLRNT